MVHKPNSIGNKYWFKSLIDSVNVILVQILSHQIIISSRSFLATTL